MRNRCKYPSTYAWKWYGGKGIRVCERWDSDYGNFLADMGEAPEGMSIDRIDCSKDYSPENCRWSTQTEQMNNNSRNLIVEHEGQRMTVAQVARATGNRYKPLHYLITQKGMSADDAVAELRRRHAAEA
jgi:membrane-bound inhibitor of C-type lysozyme